MESVYLSVIIPAFNEQKRIQNTLVQIMAFLRERPYGSEILLIDDGSTDQTLAVASEALADFPHEILRSSRNRGKGNAVKRGMLAANGQFLLFTDADLSTPITELDRFLEALDSGYDIVIGSRALKGASVEVRQEFYREMMGKCFNRIARLMSFRGIADSQCGFKCFRRDAAKILFGMQKLDGFAFDAEIMYLAQCKNYRILECPVTWRHSSETRVRLFRDPVQMFSDLIRIKRLHGKPCS